MTFDEGGSVPWDADANVKLDPLVSNALKLSRTSSRRRVAEAVAARVEIAKDRLTTDAIYLLVRVAEASMEARENLFRLELDRLVIPAPLARGEVRCLRATVEDVQLLTEWRVEYCVEAMGDRESPELVASSRRDIERVVDKRACFVLRDAGDRVVSTSGFNAELPDCVQIGGVYTPKALRGRGYAQAVVAGSLLVSRDAGVSCSILFTREQNVAACHAYRALGYAIIGDYGLVRFRAPMQPVPDDGRFEA